MKDPRVPELLERHLDDAGHLSRIRKKGWRVVERTHEGRDQKIADRDVNVVEAAQHANVVRSNTELLL